MKFQRTHFRTGFTHEKNTFSVGRWWVQKIFFFCFSCGKPSVGTKKKRPGYPKKNISSLIQTWKQKLIYKTFHLVSQFVFHVWDRIYKTTLLHVWKTKWKKSLCKRKPDFFFCFEHEKKTLKCISSCFLSSFFLCLEENKRNEKWFVFACMKQGKRFGRRRNVFILFSNQTKTFYIWKKIQVEKKCGQETYFLS